MKCAAWLKRTITMFGVALVTLSGFLAGLGRADMVITGMPNISNPIKGVPSGTVINIDATSDAGGDAAEPNDDSTQSDTLVLTYTVGKSNDKATCTLTEKDENSGAGYCKFDFLGLQWKQGEIARFFDEGNKMTSDLYLRYNISNPDKASVVLCSDDKNGKISNFCTTILNTIKDQKGLKNMESFKESPTVTPEPSTLALLLGVLAVGFVMLRLRLKTA